MSCNLLASLQVKSSQVRFLQVHSQLSSYPQLSLPNRFVRVLDLVQVSSKMSVMVSYPKVEGQESRRWS